MTGLSDDLLAALTPVVEELERLGVKHYVGGSAVSSNYGVARATLDVDLVADLSQQHVTALVEALRADYYVDARMISEAIARQSCFNAIHIPTSFKVDVFVVKNRPYDRMALQRIRKDSLDDEQPAQLFFQASPEDIILSKLEWYRLGDEVSDSQWRDVLGVLRVQHDALDRPYLQKWAPELGLTDLLEKAWKEANK
jgi:hypothetical protein